MSSSHPPDFGPLARISPPLQARMHKASDALCTAFANLRECELHELAHRLDRIMEPEAAEAVRVFAAEAANVRAELDSLACFPAGPPPGWTADDHDACSVCGHMRGNHDGPGGACRVPACAKHVGGKCVAFAERAAPIQPGDLTGVRFKP